MGLREALRELRLPSAQLLEAKGLGLSLSDQYWIRPGDSDLQWEKVNFFENVFSEDVGKVLFGQQTNGRALNLMSPDNTSDGWLKKKWKILDGKRCLIKGGSGATQQEPYNEVLASRIMDRLGIRHVAYTLLVEDGYPYSVCEDFLTAQTELVTAWYVMQTAKKPNHLSVYRHYVECCERLGVPDIREALDGMLVVDFLMANEDRHQNNFGIVRQARTLFGLGAAPVFDTGTSLWFDKPTALIGKTKLTCKPFKTSHEEQLRLVHDFGRFDPAVLLGIEEEFREIVRDSVFIDEARRDALCLALRERVRAMERIVREQKAMRLPDDDIRGDVAENIAYSGDGSET